MKFNITEVLSSLRSSTSVFDEEDGYVAPSATAAIPTTTDDEVFADATDF